MVANWKASHGNSLYGSHGNNPHGRSKKLMFIDVLSDEYDTVCI